MINNTSASVPAAGAGAGAGTPDRSGLSGPSSAPAAYRTFMPASVDTETLPLSKRTAKELPAEVHQEMQNITDTFLRALEGGRGRVEVPDLLRLQGQGFGDISWLDAFHQADRTADDGTYTRPMLQQLIQKYRHNPAFCYALIPLADGCIWQTPEHGKLLQYIEPNLLSPVPCPQDERFSRPLCQCLLDVNDMDNLLQDGSLKDFVMGKKLTALQKAIHKTPYEKAAYLSFLLKSAVTDVSEMMTVLQVIHRYNPHTVEQHKTELMAFLSESEKLDFQSQFARVFSPFVPSSAQPRGSRPVPGVSYSAFLMETQNIPQQQLSEVLANRYRELMTQYGMLQTRDAMNSLADKLISKGAFSTATNTDVFTQSHLTSHQQLAAIVNGLKEDDLENGFNHLCAVLAASDEPIFKDMLDYLLGQLQVDQARIEQNIKRWEDCQPYLKNIDIAALRLVLEEKRMCPGAMATLDEARITQNEKQRCCNSTLFHLVQSREDWLDKICQCLLASHSDTNQAVARHLRGEASSHNPVLSRKVTDCLIDNRRLFVNSINYEELFPYLHQQDILSLGENQEIEAYVTSIPMNRALIMTVQRKIEGDSTWAAKFLQALKYADGHAGHAELVQKLEASIAEASKP